MNWLDCASVEAIPGKVSGAPIIKGTRVPVQTVIDNFNAGVTEAEISDLYDVPLASVKSVIKFSRATHGSGHF